MLILDLWGISFHAVVVFGLGKNLLLKSILGRCVNLVMQCQTYHSFQTDGEENYNYLFTNTAK